MNVGDALGVFRLSGIDSDGSTERIFDSAELAGRPAVLAFYPADQSVVCTMQLNHYALPTSFSGSDRRGKPNGADRLRSQAAWSAVVCGEMAHTVASRPRKRGRCSA